MRSTLIPMAGVILGVLVGCGGGGDASSAPLSQGNPSGGQSGTQVAPAGQQAPSASTPVAVAAISGPTDSLGIAISNRCANVRGASAVMWDLEQGLLRTDLPSGFPRIESVGGAYENKIDPILRFNFPAGWTAADVEKPGSIGGAVLTRNDGKAIWKLERVVVQRPGGLAIRELRDQQVLDLLRFLGLQSDLVQPVCEIESSYTVLPITLGIVQSYSRLLFRNQGVLGFVGVSALNSGTGGVAGQYKTRFKVAAGPAAEFDQLIENTFLAVDFQMLFVDPATPADADRDGTPDVEDDDPRDPRVTRQ